MTRSQKRTQRQAAPDEEIHPHGLARGPRDPGATGGQARPSSAEDGPAHAASPTGSAGRGWLTLPEEGALSEHQERQLDALFGRILPADEPRGVPGAKRARASRFVSLLLAGDAQTYEEIPDWREAYPAWLAALDAYAVEELGAALVDLPPERLDAILTGLEAATLVGLPADLDQKRMFRTLYRHCIQGCFADPRWGGNEDRVMWRWFGYLQAPEEVR